MENKKEMENEMLDKINGGKGEWYEVDDSQGIFDKGSEFHVDWIIPENTDLFEQI